MEGLEENTFTDIFENLNWKANNSVNRNTEVICAFCYSFDHSIDQCYKRKKTPYCPNCALYEHIARAYAKKKLQSIDTNNVANDNYVKHESKYHLYCLNCAIYGKRLRHTVRMAKEGAEIKCKKRPQLGGNKSTGVCQNKILILKKGNQINNKTAN